MSEEDVSALEAEVIEPTLKEKQATNKQHSLQRFLFVVLFLSVAAPAILTGTVLIRENFHRTIDQDSMVSANNYADLLQAGMTMPLWNVAPSLGQPLLDTVRIDPSVLKIVVQGTKGEIFLEYTKPEFTEEVESLKLFRDITFENEPLGDVELVYSLTSARLRAVNESRLLLTIILIQLICSLALMSYFLRKRVFTPLTKLERAAIGIAGGDLKTTIPALKNDEFGGLSHQLETMRGSLEQSFTTLEERVRERTAELVDLNKELKGTLDKLQQAQGNLVQQEKLVALGSLVAGVAHELNTPIGNGLTVASSISDATHKMSELMREGMTRAALESYLTDMGEGSHLVVASLERASELVSSFKQVAVDRTSTQRRQFNLKEMLAETRLTLSPMFKHTPYIVKITVPDDVTMDSYPGPLGQVVTNLFSNALIHAFDGRDHGEVSIEVTKEDEADFVTMRVADNGGGIPEENRTRIFDPFFTTKLGEGGNGLGMHIVHNIVTGVLGGTIHLDSEVGKGTIFIIRIPLIAPRITGDGSNLVEGFTVNE